MNKKILIIALMASVTALNLMGKTMREVTFNNTTDHIMACTIQSESKPNDVRTILLMPRLKQPVLLIVPESYNIDCIDQQDETMDERVWRITDDALKNGEQFSIHKIGSALSIFPEAGNAIPPIPPVRGPQKTPPPVPPRTYQEPVKPRPLPTPTPAQVWEAKKRELHRLYGNVPEAQLQKTIAQKAAAVFLTSDPAQKDLLTREIQVLKEILGTEEVEEIPAEWL